MPEVSLVDLVSLDWLSILIQQRRHEEETASEGETSGNNYLQPHFHEVKF